MHRCRYCKRWPCTCHGKWSVEERRAYYDKVEGWSFLGSPTGRCPVPDCHRSVYKRFDLCHFHRSLLPMDLVVRGFPATEVLELDDGELLEVDLNLISMKVKLAVAAEKIWSRR